MKSHRKLQILGISLLAAAFQVTACGSATPPAPTPTQPQPAAPTQPAATQVQVAAATAVVSVAPTVAPTKAPSLAPTRVPTKPAAPTPTAAPARTPVPRTPTAVAAASPRPTAPAARATPAAVATPVLQQLPSGLADCGADLGCLIEASRAGKLAKVDYTMSVDFFGLFAANTDSLVIKAKDGDRLVFFQQTIAADAALTEALMAAVEAKGMSDADVMKALNTASGVADLIQAANMASAGLSPDAVNQLKAARESQQARIGTGRECKFPQKELTAMLERWQQGSYSSSDYDPAQCTNIGTTASTGISVEIPAKSATAAPTAKPGAQGTGAIFGKELIVNGNAETGPSASSDTEIVPPSGWKVTGNFTAVKYGSKGVLGKEQAQSGDGDITFFAGGPNNALSSASQTIDVAAGAAAIDGGEARFELSGYLGGLGSQEDTASVTLTFKGADNKVLGTNVMGPPAAADRNKSDGYVGYGASHYVPKGTRSIEVTVTMKRASGSYNDGYADGISLKLVDESAG